MKSKSKLASIGAGLCLLCFLGTVQGQESGAAEKEEVPPAKFNWRETFRWSADLRLRYDKISETSETDRGRDRLRARFAFGMQASESIDFDVRIATSDGDPVSTNISFDNGFSSIPIAIDRAFISWQATSGLSLLAGKMPRPWFRPASNSLHFDNDLNPQGVVLLYDSAGGRFFGSFGRFTVDERSGGDDTLLITAQGGIEFDIGGDSQLTAALGYFDYTNTIGNTPFYLDQPKGNSVDAAGNLIYDYDILELGVEFDTKIGEFPLTFFAVAAQNSEALEDMAYAIGAKVSSLTSRGNLDLSYAYHSTDADAVIGTFTDSDFAGGNTDSNGHFIRAKYALKDNIELGATFIISERGEFAGNETDYNRVQLDIEFLFE
jgi:hypothetical protein